MRDTVITTSARTIVEIDVILRLAKNRDDFALGRNHTGKNLVVAHLQVFAVPDGSSDPFGPLG
jgi:hypothetical protein